MANQVSRKTRSIALSRQRMRAYAWAFACAALLVVLATVTALRQSGQALTRQVEVLDCHFDGEAAHTHTADCYENGELVCNLLRYLCNNAIFRHVKI